MPQVGVSAQVCEFAVENILVKNALFIEQEVLSGPSSFATEKRVNTILFKFLPGQSTKLKSSIEVIIPDNLLSPSYSHSSIRITGKGEYIYIIYILLKGKEWTDYPTLTSLLLY